MSRGAAWTGLALSLVALAGCGRTTMPGGPGPEVHLRLGLMAIEGGDHPLGIHHLARAISAGGPTGTRARLSLAAAHLDPRNPTRQPDLAALEAARFLTTAPATDPATAEARILYLLALEHGGGEPILIPTDPIADVPAPLPRLPVRSIPEIIAGLEADLSSLMAEREALERERDQLLRDRARLAHRLEEAASNVIEKERELERIRRTLRQR